MPFSTGFTSNRSYYASSNITSPTGNPNEVQTAESGYSYSQSTQTDRDGTTTVRTIRQGLGEPVIVEEHRYDADGRELAALPDARSEGMRRIEDLDEDEQAV
ncbi:hypothetical protein BJX99DRAFT_225642 [Aspergillus californicus]